MEIKDVLDAVPIGTLVVDRELRVLHWNRTLETWTGVKGEAILGRPLHEPFPGTREPAYVNRLQGIFDGGPPVIFSAQVHGSFIPARLPDGNLRVQHTVVSAVPDGGGGGYHAFVSIQDVTEITRQALNYRKARNEAVEEIKRREVAERELAGKSAQLEASYRETVKLNANLSELNRMIEQDLNLAGEFQGSLLPNVSPHKFLRIASRRRPWRVVSGDVYDVARNREGHVAVFLGDATGHGTTAAFLTMMLHMGFRSLNGLLTTAQALESLNQMLISVDTGGKFITGVLARITQAGDLRVAHAGHHSAVVLAKGGTEIVTFEAGGIPLGMFGAPLASYREEQSRLNPGDRIYLYTDGLSERLDGAGEQFGDARLIEILAANRERDLESVLDAVLVAVDEFAGGTPAHDDITLAGLEFLGLPPP